MCASEEALNNEVKIAFGQGNLRWKPGHLRSAYGAICCRFFNQRIWLRITGLQVRAMPGASNWLSSACRWFLTSKNERFLRFHPHSILPLFVFTIGHFFAWVIWFNETDRAKFLWTILHNWFAFGVRLPQEIKNPVSLFLHWTAKRWGQFRGIDGSRWYTA